MNRYSSIQNMLLRASDLLSDDVNAFSQDLGLDPEEVERVLGGEPTSDPALRAIVALGGLLGQSRTAAAGDAPSGDLPEWGTRAELLATASGVPLSKIESVLSEYPIEKLPMLQDATYKKLGVSSVAARRIRAAIKLAIWVQIQIRSPKSRASDARAIYQRFKYIEFYEQEVFICVLLNNRNEIIQSVQVSKGALDTTQVHPREAFQPAIRIGARSIVFVHNHPSGDSTPSSEDRALTERLIEVGKLVGIPVLDHVIIGLRGYFSFAESGMMKEGMQREAGRDDYDDFSWEEEEAEEISWIDLPRSQMHADDLEVYYRYLIQYQALELEFRRTGWLEDTLNNRYLRLKQEVHSRSKYLLSVCLNEMKRWMGTEVGLGMGVSQAFSAVEQTVKYIKYALLSEDINETVVALQEALTTLHNRGELADYFIDLGELWYKRPPSAQTVRGFLHYLSNHPLAESWKEEALKGAPLRKEAALARATSDISSDTGYLYHVTTEERAADILQKGRLFPRSPWWGTDQSTWPDGGTEKRSYWSDKADIVWQFAPEEGSSSVVLRVPITAGTFEHESTGDYFTRESISVRYLEILEEDGTWIPLREAF